MDANDLRRRIRIHDLVRGCKNCGLCRVGSGPIPFKGPSPANIAIIGEAPGECEDREGKPFVGPSGLLAQRWLSNAGLDPASAAWLNVVSCYPNRAPNPREVEACKDTLAIQLEAIRPEWVLVLGGIACSRWWRVRVGDLRGLWWTIPDGTRPSALATWHPSAVLRNPTLGKQAETDVKRFVDAAVRERIWFLREGYCVICHKEKVLRWDDKNLGWCYKHDPISQAGGGRRVKFPANKGPKPRQAMGML